MQFFCILMVSENENGNNMNTTSQAMHELTNEQLLNQHANLCVTLKLMEDTYGASAQTVSQLREVFTVLDMEKFTRNI